jgi:hypothetical protein
MSEDGNIAYSGYSDAELQNVLEHIDSVNNPKNYQNLLSVIESRRGDSTPATASTKIRGRFSIPKGRLGLIEIPLDKKYIVPFRAIMLIVAAPFVVEVYDVLRTGIADKGSYIVTRGEDFGYYAHLAKYLAFAFLFLWLGSFGVADKKVVASREE